MEDIVSQTKSEYVRAKERMIKLLSLTPDDKINWSPSPEARTPIELVVHSAMAIDGILDMLTGKGNGDGDIAQMDAYLRKEEKAYTTRQQALDLLDKNTTKFFAFLDTLTPEQLSSTIKGFVGTYPMSEAIMFPSYHMRGHSAQLEYVQTIWGDHDWYF